MVTKPEDLLGRRVRIYLGVATRGEMRVGREMSFVEGVVERHDIYGFVVPAKDGRVPFVVDKNRILDVWNSGDRWEPVFDGRVPREPTGKKPVTTRCSNCGEVGHNRLKCKRRK